MSRFTEGQAVTVMLQDGEQPMPGRVLQNIDATCAPLKDMWLIKVDGWNRPFGISGAALVPANRP